MIPIETLLDVCAAHPFKTALAVALMLLLESVAVLLVIGIDGSQYCKEDVFHVCD